MLSKDHPKPKPACEAPERLMSDWKPVLLYPRGQLTTDTNGTKLRRIWDSSRGRISNSPNLRAIHLTTSSIRNLKGEPFNPEQ